MAALFTSMFDSNKNQEKRKERKERRHYARLRYLLASYRHYTSGGNWVSFMSLALPHRQQMSRLNA
jgi:hypothetical protein